VRKHGLLVCLLVAVVALSVSARQGSFLDKLTFIEEQDQVASLNRFLAGEIDMHGYQVTGGAVQILIDNNIPYELAFAGYRGILYNIPNYFDDGRFNPLGDPIIDQATQKLMDRDYMCQEFLFGNAIPMYSPVLPSSPTGTQIIVETTKTKLAFAFDEATALQMINDRMLELGFSKNAAGHWVQAGFGEIEIVGTIRVSDERWQMGDYFCDQLEKAGFVTRRIYGSSGDLWNYWGGTLPGEGTWNFYTEGWGSGAIDLQSVWAWAQMYTDMAAGGPPYDQMTEEWCTEEFGPDFYSSAQGILQGTYATVEERLQYFATCEAAMRENPTHFWSWNNASAYMYPEGISVVHDLAAGNFLHQFVGHTLRYVDADGAPIMGGAMVVSNQSFLTNAINPIDGSNWTYDLMFMRPTMDSGCLIHPHTGVPMAHFLKHAKVEVVEGSPVGIFPVTVEDGWCELHFVPSITVPGDAWADWDAVNQVFLTVDEVYPGGVTDAKSKVTLEYQPFVTNGTLKWHDGSPFSFADVVMCLIVGFPFDRAKPESEIYDDTQVAAYEAGMDAFRGVKFLSQNPIIAECYSTGISLYAELMANGRDALVWPTSGEAGTQPAWHQIALAYKVEAQGLGAMGQGKAAELGIDWMNFVDGPQLQYLLTELTTARMTNFVPYWPTMQNYLTTAEIVQRYQNLEEFAAKYNHLWIGTGPMILTQVDPLASITVLENNPDYVYEAGHYLGRGFDTVAIPEVAVSGPSTISIGAEAVFNVAITLEGEAYAADLISEIVYLLVDAAGNVYDGDGVVTGDGAGNVTLSGAITGALGTGANQLTVVVVSKTVAFPGQVTVTFTTL
jgi:peptide/nickel transport system substrate-binding protein